MMLVEPSTTGTTQDAAVYAPAQSTYTPYEFTPLGIKFVVSAHAPADDFAEVMARLKRLTEGTDEPTSTRAGYERLAKDDEYLAVRRETRLGSADRAARNAQD